MLLIVSLLRGALLGIVLLVGLAAVVVLGAATGGVVGAGVLVGLGWVGGGWCVLFLGSVLDEVDLDEVDLERERGRESKRERTCVFVCHYC